MTFRVEIAWKAAREIEEQYQWLAKRSRAAAARWRRSLLDAVASLEENPERFGEAPEAEYHEGLRQLIHGKRRKTHRILFEIRGEMVIVLRVRHAAQDLLGPESL